MAFHETVTNNYSTNIIVSVRRKCRHEIPVSIEFQRGNNLKGFTEYRNSNLIKENNLYLNKKRFGTFTFHQAKH